MSVIGSILGTMGSPLKVPLAPGRIEGDTSGESEESAAEK